MKLAALATVAVAVGTAFPTVGLGQGFPVTITHQFGDPTSAVPPPAQ